MTENSKNLVKFEILCVDQKSKVWFSDEDRFITSIQSNENLCSKNTDKNQNGVSGFYDTQRKINWYIQKLELKVVSDLFSSAYILTVEGEQKSIEDLRIDLLTHIRKLGFNHLRVLTDEASQHIALQIYPLINGLENLLRRYIVKFFITKIGLDWWEFTVNKNIRDKSGKRLEDRNNDKESIFLKQKLVNADVELIDFDELGDIIFQQKTAFSNTEDIIRKIEDSTNLEDLKASIQGNYSRYFKEYFEEKDFKRKWNRCFEIRNKVAHNSFFTKQDLEDAISLINELTNIINNADKEIDRAVFSLAEKEALINTASMLVDNKQSELENSDSEADNLQREIMNHHSNSSDEEKYSNRVISEEEVIEQLKNTESRFRDGFVGLRLFVTEILKKQGYDPSISYAVINVLSDKQKIEIYDVDNTKPNVNFPTKAVRLINKE